MKSKFSRKVWTIATSSALAMVAACGSGGGGGLSVAESTAAALTSALAAISENPANYSSFIALLDADYKQDGITNAQLKNMLAADALEGVSFPNVSYTNANVSNCNASKICDMTVTVSNNDVDLLSTTMTLKVKETVTGYFLIGDQSAS